MVIMLSSVIPVSGEEKTEVVHIYEREGRQRIDEDSREG